MHCSEPAKPMYLVNVSFEPPSSSSAFASSEPAYVHSDGLQLLVFEDQEGLGLQNRSELFALFPQTSTSFRAASNEFEASFSQTARMRVGRLRGLSEKLLGTSSDQANPLLPIVGVDAPLLSGTAR